MAKFTINAKTKDDGMWIEKLYVYKNDGECIKVGNPKETYDFDVKPIDGYYNVTIKGEIPKGVKYITVYPITKDEMPDESFMILSATVSGRPVKAHTNIVADKYGSIWQGGIRLNGRFYPPHEITMIFEAIKIEQAITIYSYVAEESESILPPVTSLTKDQLSSLYDRYEDIISSDSAEAERDAVKSLFWEEFTKEVAV